MTNTRTQSNLRTLKSRNQREGWYAGKKRFFKTPYGLYSWGAIKPKHCRSLKYPRPLRVKPLFRGQS